MSNRLFRLCVGSLIVCLLSAATARATVSLSLSDNDATPTSAQVGPGGTVVLSVRLTATSEQTTGLDYFLRAVTGSGLFTITDRSLVGSSYPTPIFTDTQVETLPGALLNPDNDVDLGASVNNVMSPLAPGSNYLVANLTIAVSPSAAPGSYTIQTFSQPGTGWVGAGVGDPPDFPESAFNNHGTFTIAVPEPAGLGLLGLAGAALIARRRRMRSAA